MKFFPEFVLCCGPVGGSPEEATETAGRRAEGSRPLVRTISTAMRRQRKKKRINSADSAGEWKPTLGAISEDYVLAEAQRPERQVKRKSNTGGGEVRNIARFTSQTEDYRRHHFPTLIPAFSPTPFMI